jgi:mono/diheme cytochrome c family protein
MNTLTELTIIGTMLALSACTSGYLAPATAGGADIYTSACAGCHSPLRGGDGAIFELDGYRAQPQYVMDKVRNGSLRMPKFPGMTDAQLKSLAAFVLDHNRSTTPPR